MLLRLANSLRPGMVVKVAPPDQEERYWCVQRVRHGGSEGVMAVDLQRGEDLEIEATVRLLVTDLVEIDLSEPTSGD